MNGEPVSPEETQKGRNTCHLAAISEKAMVTHSRVLAWRVPGTGACWAATYGAAQSRTRLKRLSSSSSSYQAAATAHAESSGNRMLWKRRTLARGSSELQHLHLSIHRKALSSLTWDIWFSLINNHLLMFRPPALCCKTFLWPTFPLHRLGVILSGLLEIPGLKSLKIPTG